MPCSKIATQKTIVYGSQLNYYAPITNRYSSYPKRVIFKIVKEVELALLRKEASRIYGESI